MDKNIIVEKSLEFAVRIVNVYKYLRHEKREFVMSKQLLRSGTSIGANIAEGEKGQSRPDFYSKMSVALKEANETKYWLTLLHRTDYLSAREFKSLEKDVNEILAILIAICRSTTT